MLSSHTVHHKWWEEGEWGGFTTVQMCTKCLTFWTQVYEEEAEDQKRAGPPEGHS